MMLCLPRTRVSAERTRARREVKRMTGGYTVPSLVRDDGSFIEGSREIAALAGESGAPAGEAA
jgi:hypothetical protein